MFFHSHCPLHNEDYETEISKSDQGTLSTLIATAEKAAADNHLKARREASRGAFHFAKIHEAASISYAKDAQSMIEHNWPVHHSFDHYLGIAKTYQHLDRTRDNRRPQP